MIEGEAWAKSFNDYLTQAYQRRVTPSARRYCSRDDYAAFYVASLGTALLQYQPKADEVVVGRQLLRLGSRYVRWEIFTPDRRPDMVWVNSLIWVCAANLPPGPISRWFLNHMESALLDPFTEYLQEALTVPQTERTL